MEYQQETQQTREISRRVGERLLQQHLVLLLHAHNCQTRELLDTEGTYKCTLPYCKETKEGLDHMRSCQTGHKGSCTYDHCDSSQKLISHWKSCYRKDCRICEPVRAVSRK